MEFSISAPPSFYKKENPIYPCDSVPESAKIACARSQTQVMRLRFGLETGEIASACLGTKNENISFHCTDALGYFAAQGSAGNTGHILSECGQISVRGASAQCVEAAAGELVFQNARGWREAVEELCGALDTAYRDSCEKRVANVKRSYGR